MEPLVSAGGSVRQFERTQASANRRRRAGSAATIVVASILLGGCVIVPSASSTSGASPATGPELSGTGYTLHLPRGWTQQDTHGLPGLDALALSDTITDGVKPSLNIMDAPSKHVPDADAQTVGRDELDQEGYTTITLGAPVEVAGHNAVHLSGRRTVSGTALAEELFVVSSRTKTFLVVFTMPGSVNDRQLTQLTDSVLGTWAWGSHETSNALVAWSSERDARGDVPKPFSRIQLHQTSWWVPSGSVGSMAYRPPAISFAATL